MARQFLFRQPGQIQEASSDTEVDDSWLLVSDFVVSPGKDFLNIRSESHFLPPTRCDTCVWSCKTLQWSQPPAATLGPALLPNFTSMAFQLCYKLLGFTFCLRSARSAFTDTYISICLKGACYFLKDNACLRTKSSCTSSLPHWPTWYLNVT